MDTAHMGSKNYFWNIVFSHIYSILGVIKTCLVKMDYKPF